ncbi:MAG: glycolate oxidase subunit GlcF [Gammaproteobacteria bacterium]
MQTQLAPFIKDTPRGRLADSILRACVHCGFCTATCPTYQLLGDELDGPRGRIYQIKQVLEGLPASPTVQTHLDRCLTCRSCESTCPSGVRYGRLLDIGREVVEEQVDRPWPERIKRALLLAVLPYPSRFGPLLRLGQALRPLLPHSVRAKVPTARPPGPRPRTRHARTVIALAGCAQASAAPLTNAASARVLDRLGITLMEAPGAGCCGAANHHMSDSERAREMARSNIDAWWPLVQDGAEAVLMTASGCGQMVKDYGDLLADDPAYAERAARIADLTRDLGEVLGDEDLTPFARCGSGRRVAFHAPCTLQHGQKLPGLVESVLGRCGFELTPVADAHLCCGSAGTYSLLQTQLSNRLRANKVETLAAGAPDMIATANIGCQLHLDGGSDIPVVHWIELLDPGDNP